MSISCLRYHMISMTTSYSMSLSVLWNMTVEGWTYLVRSWCIVWQPSRNMGIWCTPRQYAWFSSLQKNWDMHFAMTPWAANMCMSISYENVWVWTATNQRIRNFSSWPIHKTSARTFIETANMSDRPTKVSSCHHRNSCPHGLEPTMWRNKQCGKCAKYTNFKYETNL